MSQYFAAAMRRAALSTRAKVTNATNVIQESLGKRLGRGSFPLLLSKQPPPPEPSTPSGEIDQISVEASGSQRVRRPLGEVLRAIGELHAMPGLPGQFAGINLPGTGTSTLRPIAPGAQFLTRSIAGPAGTREYKLYIPASAGCPVGLLVMLHGCKQDPDDFAAGTNMNTVAEANGLIVAYPRQSISANASACWNWFNPGDQMRDAGEPAIIAAMTRELMAEFSLERYQVFMAGLSAGGAMAAIMRETYPDLYEAVGIHSGLGYRCANDVVSAFAAMRGDSAPEPRASTRTGPTVRMIVFHGSADSTVAPSNANRIVASAGPSGSSSRQVVHGRAAGGRNYTRTTIIGASGKTPMVESWLIDGGPHAWSGGQPSGSYTDPQGPDASAEMVRFFLNRTST